MSLNKLFVTKVLISNFACNYTYRYNVFYTYTFRYTLGINVLIHECVRINSINFNVYIFFIRALEISLRNAVINSFLTHSKLPSACLAPYYHVKHTMIFVRYSQPNKQQQKTINILANNLNTDHALR